MNKNFEKFIESELLSIKEKGFFKEEKIITSKQGREITVGGSPSAPLRTSPSAPLRTSRMSFSFSRGTGRKNFVLRGSCAKRI